MRRRTRQGWLLAVLAMALMALAIPVAAGESVIDPDGGTAEGTGIAVENSLNPFMRVTQTGDYVAAGVGLRGLSSATIELQGIPGTAAVTHAYLYWAVMTFGAPERDFAIGMLNGHRFRGTLIASGLDTCWGSSADMTHVYRADVTRFVSSSGTYTLSDMPAMSGLLEGASLVVVYKDRAADPHNIVIYDGIDVIEHATFAVATEMTIRPARSRSAKTTYVVADGQDAFSDTTLFNGVTLAVDPAGVGDDSGLEGSDGPMWDTDTYDVSDLVEVGARSVTVGLARGTDCVAHIVQVFSDST